MEKGENARRAEEESTTSSEESEDELRDSCAC
jgi:hypothetical protein